MYIIRLDDASEYMDVKKWDRIENLLDKYSIKPLVGVIPNNNDPSMVNYYVKNIYFQMANLNLKFKKRSKP